MTIENMKATSFKNASLDEWKEKASASLKGKSIDSLNTRTYEKIVLKPLYTKDDIQEGGLSDTPGQQDYSRGIYPLGYQSESWNIANRLTYATLAELEEKMKSVLSKGQTAISFDVKPGMFTDNKKLISFLESLGTDRPYSLNAGMIQAPLLAAIILANKKIGTNSVSGFVAADPVAEASLYGSLPMEENQFFKEWSEMLGSACVDLPNLKTVLVNAAPYHNSGANAVQELAIAISTGVYLLQKLMENGWELKKALSKIVFHFPIGSDFFMEMAKLRAARLLWNKTAEAFGAKPEDRKMVISAETSVYTKTVFDPYVNMLRAGSESFAAVLGGIQYLHTSTFDEALGKSDSYSERIARNTQLILKSEAHLEKVADPAGGSWYVETLTRQLAEKSWELFLEIDSSGGILEVLKTGWLQEQISEITAERESDIFKRRKSIIGTNVYANLSEQGNEPPADYKDEYLYMGGSMADISKLVSASESLSGSFTKLVAESMFTPLKKKRLAEPYETLRIKAQILAEKIGANPSVGLICLGEIKKHKARADFISGMLAAGGIHAVRSVEIENITAADEFIKSNNFKQFVICGDQADYANMGIELTRELKKLHSGVQLFVAGLPEEKEAEEWKSAGIEEFIHLKSDVYQILSGLLQEMEVSSVAKA